MKNKMPSPKKKKMSALSDSDDDDAGGEKKKLEQQKKKQTSPRKSPQKVLQAAPYAFPPLSEMRLLISDCEKRGKSTYANQDEDEGSVETNKKPAKYVVTIPASLIVSEGLRNEKQDQDDQSTAHTGPNFKHFRKTKHLYQS